jgi:hypothetical protein
MLLFNTNKKFAHTKNVLHVSSVERHLAGANIENMFESCAFLEYYVASNGVVIPPGCFGTTYRSLDFLTLGDGTISNCHCTLRNIPEERMFRLHRGGSLKSRIKHI